MAEIHTRIAELIHEEFRDLPGDTRNDSLWMAEAAQDHYLATVAQALEMLKLDKLS